MPPPAFTSPPLWRLPLPPSFSSLRPYRITASASPNPIPNLRDVASAAPRLVRPRAVFRGAAPACVRPSSSPSSSPSSPSSSDDAPRFLRSVACFVDLRSRDERRVDPHARLRELCGADLARREASVPLLNRRLLLQGLAKALPRGQVLHLAREVLRKPTGARARVAKRMDQGGLALLNRVLVEASGREIARAMRTIVHTIREQDVAAEAATADIWVPPSTDVKALDTRDLDPVYIFCSAGKDRTGLLVAILLSLLGASDDQIIRDYVKSAETWENGPYYLREDYSRKLFVFSSSFSHFSFKSNIITIPNYIALSCCSSSSSSFLSFASQAVWNILGSPQKRGLAPQLMSWKKPSSIFANASAPLKPICTESDSKSPISPLFAMFWADRSL